MNSGTISLPLAVSGFTPGDEVQGTASWTLTQKPASGKVNLFWYVEQRALPDIRLVETVQISTLTQSGQFSFRFTLPAGPYSYSGNLFSVHWALELLFEPELLDVRQRIVLSPTGRPCTFLEEENIDL